MSQTVDDIRSEIDKLDNTIHDLLMQRAELILRIGDAKRRGKVQPVQPDREAVMIRRLLNRHKGPLPKESIVRIWRELVGAVSLLQTGLKVAVCAPDDQTGLAYWDMAKDYFSSVLPMVKSINPMNALSAVREREVSFAVLPWPGDGDGNPWWHYLMNEEGDSAMRIMARLPMGDRSREEANPERRALVVARIKFETSGDDRSFLALQLPSSVSRARLVDSIKALSLIPRSLSSADARDGMNTLHLLEVDSFVDSADPRIALLLERLEATEGRCVVVGGYPVPPVYDDKVGKNASAGLAAPANSSANAGPRKAAS